MPAVFQASEKSHGRTLTLYSHPQPEEDQTFAREDSPWNEDNWIVCAVISTIEFSRIALLIQHSLQRVKKSSTAESPNACNSIRS
jgi:hypothetical protein